MTRVLIHGFAPSTYTKTALLVAAEVGLDVELTPLEFKQPSHYRLHPYGKMPVLEHGELKLFETLAIETYLDRVFGGSKLEPSDPVVHARMLQWVSAAIDYAYEDLVAQLHADQPDAEAVARAAEQLKLLDAALGDAPYFAGDQLTLADFMLFPMVEFARTKLSDTCLDSLSALRRWHAALSQRPSVKKAA